MKNFYCDKNGIIKMISDSPINAGALKEFKLEPTITDVEGLLNPSSIKKVIDGKLVFEKSQSELEKEKLIQEVQSASTISELKEKIIKIIQ